MLNLKVYRMNMPPSPVVCTQVYDLGGPPENAHTSVFWSVSPSPKITFTRLSKKNLNLNLLYFTVQLMKNKFTERRISSLK